MSCSFPAFALWKLRSFKSIRAGREPRPPETVCPNSVSTEHRVIAAKPRRLIFFLGRPPVRQPKELAWTGPESLRKNPTLPTGSLHVGVRGPLFLPLGS